MAGASEMVQGWLNSGGKADSPEAAAAASTTLPTTTMDTPTDLSSAEESYEQEVRAENSTLEDLLPGEDTPSDSDSDSKKAAATAEKEKPSDQTSTKEVITVTDEQGRKRKVEVDFSNRERIKKAFSMEAGARKWQAERDNAIGKVREVTNQLGEIQANWNKLDNAFQQNGAEGLYDLLNGPGAFQAHIAKQVERAKFIENASPAQLEQLKQKEAYEKQQRDLDKLRKDNEDFKKSIESEREVAETRSLESKIHPVFDKYRFADKLGDPNDDHIFDQMLWKTSMDRLEEMETKGVDLTPELINREFSEVAQRIRKRIGVQAEKKATRVVEAKKREATENVQSKVMSGYRPSENAKEARALLDSGNLTGLMKNWAKYGKLFNK